MSFFRCCCGGHVNPPGCTCTGVSTTLNLSVSNPSYVFYRLQSATLQWTTTPAWAARLNLGASCFLSTTTYVDQFTPDPFYFYLYCLGGTFYLSRVYQTSVFGSPYRDTVRYRWASGAPGNSCSPLLLANGTIYPGGDPRTVATVS